MNILIDAMTNIGDVLLYTPALRKIKEQNPNCKIIALVRPYTFEVVDHNSLVDEVIVFDVKSKKSGFLHMFRIVGELRCRNIQRVYLFDGKLRGAILAKLAGIPEIVGPLRTDNHKYAALLLTEKRNFSKEVMHQALRYLKIVDPNAETISGLTMSEPTAGEIAHVESLMQELDLADDEKLICMCTKGTFPLKDWPAENFVRLITRLLGNYKCKIAVVGAKGDHGYVDDIILHARGLAYNLAGKTSLRELWVLLNKADLFVTVDTGAMHIGATAGVPMIALFGCTSPAIYGPLRQEKKSVSVLYKALPCSPCTKKADECEQHSCLRDISLDEVWEKVGAFLQ